MTGYAESTLNVLRLALGLPSDELTQAEWQRVLEVARIERCASLAWQRSGDRIRGVAPSEIAERWRSLVLSDVARADVQLRTLGEVVRHFEAARLRTVVLKGPPLTQRIYGTRHARPSLDIDLYVPTGERRAARKVLAALGWTHVSGESPHEEVHRKVSNGHQLLIEIHSRLLDDEMFAWLDLPAPSSGVVELDGVLLAAHQGALLPACAAAHLAKHTVAPLVWVIDFRELWRGLDATGQSAARAESRRFRLAKYLDWALARVQLLENAMSGDFVALAELGYHEDGRRQSHRLRSLVRLSQSPGDAAAILWSLARGFISRSRSVGHPTPGSRNQPVPRKAAASLPVFDAGDHSPAQHPTMSDTAEPVRRLSVDDTELSGLVRDVVSTGARVWVTASGRSMSPAIPPGSRVRLAPLPERMLARGEVVLATLGGNRCVLHRVMSERDGIVHLQGDSNLTADPATPRALVIAIAEAVDVGYGPVPVSRHARRPLWRLVRRTAGSWRSVVTSKGEG